VVKPDRRDKLSEGDATDALSALEERLGYRFRERALLQTALTHRSRAHECGAEAQGHYERLEFLGDSLLGLVVSDWLYRQDEQAAEGVLSRRRQSIVRTSTLAQTAEAIALGDAILLGRGEERTGGRHKASLLADVFEALLGAVYLDGGIRSARAFVHRHLGAVMREAAQTTGMADDYKTLLQERTQAHLRRTPHYRIVSTTGPAHALEFDVEVRLDGRILGRGSGPNRKHAEQEAARQGLDLLEHEGV